MNYDRRLIRETEHLQVFLVPGEGGGELVRLGREFGLVEAEGLDELGVRFLDPVVDFREERDVPVLHHLGDVLELWIGLGLKTV